MTRYAFMGAAALLLTLVLAIVFHVAYDLLVGIAAVRAFMRDAIMKDAPAEAVL